MINIPVTKDIKLKGDTWGNITLQQTDPIIEPAVVVGSVHIRTSQLSVLIEALEQLKKEYHIDTKRKSA